MYYLTSTSFYLVFLMDSFLVIYFLVESSKFWTIGDPEFRTKKRLNMGLPGLINTLPYLISFLSNITRVPDIIENTMSVHID